MVRTSAVNLIDRFVKHWIDGWPYVFVTNADGGFIDAHYDSTENYQMTADVLMKYGRLYFVPIDAWLELNKRYGFTQIALKRTARDVGVAISHPDQIGPVMLTSIYGCAESHDLAADVARWFLFTPYYHDGVWNVNGAPRGKYYIERSSRKDKAHKKALEVYKKLPVGSLFNRTYADRTRLLQGLSRTAYVSYTDEVWDTLRRDGVAAPTEIRISSRPWVPHALPFATEWDQAGSAVAAPQSHVRLLPQGMVRAKATPAPVMAAGIAHTTFYDWFQSRLEMRYGGVCISYYGTIRFTWDPKARTMVFSDRPEIRKLLHNYIRRCMAHPDAKALIADITVKTGDSEGTHQVYMLYDAATRELEWFDPWGHPDLVTSYLTEEHIDPKTVFDEMFAKLIEYFDLPSDTKTFAPVQYCPVNRKIFQMSEEYNVTPGYCQMWCMWYLELRLDNPKVPRQTIIDHAQDMLDRYGPARFIARYSALVLEEAERHAPLANNARERMHFDIAYLPVHPPPSQEAAFVRGVARTTRYAVASVARGIGPTRIPFNWIVYLGSNPNVSKLSLHDGDMMPLFTASDIAAITENISKWAPIETSGRRTPWSTAFDSRYMGSNPSLTATYVVDHRLGMKWNPTDLLSNPNGVGYELMEMFPHGIAGKGSSTEWDIRAISSTVSREVYERNRDGINGQPYDELLLAENLRIPDEMILERWKRLYGPSAAKQPGRAKKGAKGAVKPAPTAAPSGKVLGARGHFLPALRFALDVCTTDDEIAALMTALSKTITPEGIEVVRQHYGSSDTRVTFDMVSMTKSEYIPLAYILSAPYVIRDQNRWVFDAIYDRTAFYDVVVVIQDIERMLVTGGRPSVGWNLSRISSNKDFVTALSYAYSKVPVDVLAKLDGKRMASTGCLTSQYFADVLSGRIPASADPFSPAVNPFAGWDWEKIGECVGREQVS